MEIVKALTEEEWQAIVVNDNSYDDKMIYAIKTTGIFCKPSCKSRLPNKENVYIFRNAKAALSANFRPCKRCRPTDQRLPDHEWVAQITNFIDLNYMQTIRLQTLAEMCHGSPYHLHRTFKKILGITPVEYIQNLRINKAIDYLIHTGKTIGEIGVKVGISNTTYFITLFKKFTGIPPNEYRLISGKGRDKEMNN